MNNSTTLTEDTKLLVKCIESVNLMTAGELYDDYDRRGHIFDYFVLSEGLWIPVDEVRKSDNHHVTVKITLNDGNELFFPYNSYVYPLRGNVSVLDLKLSDILRINYIPVMPVFIKNDTNTCAYSHYLGRVLGYFLSKGKRVGEEYRIILDNDDIVDLYRFTDREFEIVEKILNNAIIESNTDKSIFGNDKIYEIQPDDITVSCSPNNNSRTYTINNKQLIDFFRKFSHINDDGIPNINLKVLLNGIEFNNGIILGLKEMNRINGCTYCRNKSHLAETYEAFYSALGISRVSIEPSKDRITYFDFLQDMPPNGCYIYDNYYRRFGLGITKIEKINTDKKAITITKKSNDSSDIYPITLANGILVS